MTTSATPAAPLPPPPTADEAHPKWAVSINGVIRALWWIALSLFGFLVFVNTMAPQVFANGTFIGDNLRWLVDVLFDRPALSRARPGNEAGAPAGFVYYEVSKTGGLTPDGQLAPAPVRPMLPAFADLKAGDVLRANSSVQLRQDPTGSSQLLAVLRAGDCVVVRQGAKVAYPVKVAASGGWVPAQPSKCPQ